MAWIFTVIVSVRLCFSLGAQFKPVGTLLARILTTCVIA
jgi:hypothetical protein